MIDLTDDEIEKCCNDKHFLKVDISISVIDEGSDISVIDLHLKNAHWLIRVSAERIVTCLLKKCFLNINTDLLTHMYCWNIIAIK